MPPRHRLLDFVFDIISLDRSICERMKAEVGKQRVVLIVDR